MFQIKIPEENKSSGIFLLKYIFEFAGKIILIFKL